MNKNTFLLVLYFLAFTASPFLLQGQTKLLDLVFFKDGSVERGEILFETKATPKAIYLINSDNIRETIGINYFIILRGWNIAVKTLDKSQL